MSEEAREALMVGVVNGACATPGCGHANGAHSGAGCRADNCRCPRYAAPAAAPRVILSVHYHRTEPRVIVQAQRWSVDGVGQGAPLPVLALDRDTAQRFAEALRAAANGAGRQPLDPWVSIEGLGPLAAQLASSWGAVTDTMQAETMTGGEDAGKGWAAERVSEEAREARWREIAAPIMDGGPILLHDVREAFDAGCEVRTFNAEDVERGAEAMWHAFNEREYGDRSSWAKSSRSITEWRELFRVGLAELGPVDAS